MSSLSSDILPIINETLTILAFFSLLLFLYQLAITPSSPFYSENMSSLYPLCLIVLSCLYFAYKWYLHGHHTRNRGLFNLSIFLHIITAPLTSPTFRETYAADFLSSFTKVIMDAMYASCWILTGEAFIGPQALDDDSGRDICQAPVTSSTILVAVVLQNIRLMQCCRLAYDQPDRMIPHLGNAFKFLSTMITVVYGYRYGLTTPYFILTCFTTLFRWWWDVVMDWGLCTHLFRMNSQADASNPSSTKKSFSLPSPSVLFLRPMRLFPMNWPYYLAIASDLILRFVWILSLLPSSTLYKLFGPMISIYLGSVEILRRGMWGIVRVEWEHVRRSQALKSDVAFRLRRSSQAYIQDILTTTRNSLSLRLSLTELPPSCSPSDAVGMGVILDDNSINLKQIQLSSMGGERREETPENQTVVEEVVGQV
jgi:hypothetical protein